MANKKIVLYCISFAGGSSYSYRDFAKHLDNSIEVEAIDLPGHGKKLREALLTDINLMADHILDQIRTAIPTTPFAIYGHSMGATIGYQLCRALIREGLPMPLHLFFSSRQGPSVPIKEEGKYLHLLPQDQFIKMAMEYGGIPREVAAEKELMDLFVPIMKADFKAVAQYTYEPAPPLDIPITVLIGANEKTTYDDAMKWQEVTCHKISMTQFSGGHFFIFDHLPEIGKIISSSLGRYL
ncbi:MAG: thioesterase [Desulfamplus sp.]|nr:thioesterase [Desulfamplus sp.]